MKRNKTKEISDEEAVIMIADSIRGDMDGWFRKEWKDADRILCLDRDGMLWQIWKERSNKLLWGISGILLGLLIGSYL